MLLLLLLQLKQFFYSHNPMINTHTHDNESRPNGAPAHLTFHWLLRSTAQQSKNLTAFPPTQYM